MLARFKGYLTALEILVLLGAWFFVINVIAPWCFRQNSWLSMAGAVAIVAVLLIASVEFGAVQFKKLTRMKHND
jgi:hypothetical protein